jgi:broad specificity phosphatase PhoE
MVDTPHHIICKAQKQNGVGGPRVPGCLLPPEGQLNYKASAAMGRRYRWSQPSSTCAPGRTRTGASGPADDAMTLLIRHAESAWNEHFSASRIDIGWPDPPLTARGEEQARAAVERLRGLGLRRLITSPHRRALQTAAILAAELGLPISVDPTVRERCAFSCDQGSSPAELAREWPQLDFGGLEEIWWGGAIESWPSLAARCCAFRRTIAVAPDRDEVAVVSHWGFIRGLTGVELRNTDSIRLAHVTISNI